MRAIQSLYICSQAAVRTREGETDRFEVKCGLRQGCVLSPLLFIIFMDNIMKRANQEENSIEELMFADDLVLIAEDQSRLQEMVTNLDQQCKNYGMRISRDKTEVMVTSREPIQCDIELDGETLKQVEQFKYLGGIFVREGGCKENVKTRCLKASQVYYQLSPILEHKEITMTTKTQIIKAVFTPTLLYQSENWTLTSKERQMLTTTEMRCLRKAAGKTRMDKIRNEEIRRRVNMQPAEQTANKNKIRWWSHVKRMAPTAPQSRALVIHPVGKRPREDHEIDGKTMFRNGTRRWGSR